MRTRYPTVLATVAALALFAPLTACGSAGPSAEPRASAKEEGPGPVPSPDSAQTRELMEALKDIDPRLAESKKRAVAGAIVTCEALANGVPRKTVATTAAGNFGERLGSLDSATANRLVTAVEKSFCTTE